MAKRRKVKKNVATKVGTGGKVKSSEQSTLEKDVKKVSSCVESPQPCQPSGAKKQKLDTTTEGSPQSEKYVPPFTASQRLVVRLVKAREKLQLNKTETNSQENSSTQEGKPESQNSQNGDVDSNAESKISEENNEERKDEKILANTCLGDIKDKEISEVEIVKDKQSNELAECLGNPKVSEISDKHLLESDQIIVNKELNNDAKTKSQMDERKQVNESMCVEVPKLSLIIKRYYVDIEPGQELKIVEPIAQVVGLNPLNSGSLQEMEEGNEQGKENEQEEEEEENEQEREEENEKEREKEGGEEKDGKKEIQNTKYEEYEGTSMGIVDNQISNQLSETVQSNLPTCPQNDCKSQDIKISLAETRCVQKENEKKVITENVSDSAKNDKDELNKSDNQPNVSLTSNNLTDQQADQMVPTDIVLEKCQEREPGSKYADEQKAFGVDKKEVTSSCLNDNNCETGTNESNAAADSAVDTLSFAKEFEVLEELLPKDDMGLFDDVMGDQLKSTRDETQIPEGDSTMQFLIDELSSLNCMVMNYQKAMDEMKRHYKLSNRC